MVAMGLAYITVNSIVLIDGTVLAVQDATGEWVKTAKENAYIRMIEEIRNNSFSTTAEKEWASKLIFGIVVRDRNGDVIYDFPEDPQDFIPDGLSLRDLPGTFNGKIKQWYNPETGETEYSWHENTDDNEPYYHKGEDKKVSMKNILIQAICTCILVIVSQVGKVKQKVNNIWQK